MAETAMGGGFRKLSREVVEHFLQTVVVLDDGAFMVEPTAELVAEPDEDVPIMEERREEEAGPGTVLRGIANQLDAGVLVRRFAARGVVCGVIVPGADEEGGDATVVAARRADIVILDWQLGAEESGERATEIIQRIAEQDDSGGGRLRMIVVYTANPDLELVRDAVGKVVGDWRAEDRPGGVLALTAPHSRILFVGKGRTAEGAGRIDEHDLPGRLIDEFVELGGSMLVNVALGCIAAIREGTHRVLARFSPAMDGAFLTHRLLLATPEDAEDYAVGLVGSELAETVEGTGIGVKYSGRRAIELALAQRVAGGGEFRLMVKKGSAQGAKAITVEDVMKLVDAGPVGLSGIDGVRGGASQEGRLYERVHLLWFDDVEEGIAAHREFARVSACVRESNSVPTGYRATLGSGTIVRSGDEYLVCIQPACDAVRLKCATQFAFAQLFRDESAFDVVVPGGAGTNVGLRLNGRASDIRSIVFVPMCSSGRIHSDGADGEQAFVGETGERFLWVCDLRRALAQRFVHRLAQNLSRVGLDEFEWQRLHSPER